MASSSTQLASILEQSTICKKTKPSSRAKNPIEKCQFHQSHLENKKVYGHQVVGNLLQCGDVTIPYQLTLYDKTKVDKDNKKFTKINIAVNIISSLPEPPIQGFVLGDSYYSAEIIIKTAKIFPYIVTIIVSVSFYTVTIIVILLLYNYILFAIVAIRYIL